MRTCDWRLTANTGNNGGANSVQQDKLTVAQLKSNDNRKKRNVLTYAGVIPLLMVFIVFNMSFTAFDTSMTAVMKALHLDSLLGVQLAMLAVGSCIGSAGFRHARAEWAPAGAI